MTYSVREIYTTLQGEGVHAGSSAVFLRFTGCNLWSGLESERASAVCQFCDTQFVGIDGVGGGKFDSPESLAQAVLRAWESAITEVGSQPFVVCTGGEPLLQLDDSAIEALHEVGFWVAVETNGTLLPPSGVDWICCSPKAGSKLKLLSGDELKFVFPQDTADPAAFLELDFEHFFLQPMDGPSLEENTKLAVDYCRSNPPWRLSIQTQKLIGMP